MKFENEHYMKLTFAYSPCPNDTFMFEPIVSGRIDTEGLRFEIDLADVEQLNKAAQEERYDISKLSFNAYTRLTEQYQLLNSGSALGRKCGPLLIAKSPIDADQLKSAKVAIPGRNTTANFLLQFAYPDLQETDEMIFSDIEPSVLNDASDAGVIIHENRFTYQEKGLVKIKDLGEHWEEKTGYPIPLGGIVTRRRFTKDLRQKIDRVIARSVAYALAHPDFGVEYIKCYAQEMDADVMKSHIDLYVNDFSADIGEEGRASIQFLFDNHPDTKSGGYTTPLFVERKLEMDNDFLSGEYWSSRYANEMTGWDLGTVSPPLKRIIDEQGDKSIKLLIPGAGNAHEAEYLHRQGYTNVYVCDISQSPLQNLLERCPDFPKDHLLHQDFFQLEGQYDLILEQTFFCAINPELRPAYAKKVKALLSQGGQLRGVMFDVVFPFNGPPFGGSRAVYTNLFDQYFSSVEFTECRDSIGPRMSNEVEVRLVK